MDQHAGPAPVHVVETAGTVRDLDPNLLVLVDQDGSRCDDDRGDAVLAALLAPGAGLARVAEDDVVGSADDPLFLKPRLLLGREPARVLRALDAGQGGSQHDHLKHDRTE